MSISSDNNSLESNKLQLQHQQFNPSTVIQTDFFPDVLQHLTTEQCKAICDALSQANNLSLVNKKGPLGGYTALHWMCIKNELELAEFLLDNCRADVNCVANLGETPLFICIKNCNLYTIELVIDRGADLNHLDVYNRSLIHWSAYTGRVILFHYFQKYHSVSNLNEMDQFKQNALHIACASGFTGLIKYLIDQGGIDYMAQDFNGNTCLHMAVKCGMTRLCWVIAQQNKGECAKLIGVMNNQSQRPYDLIKNERGPEFKKIRDWLRLEAKTNKCLLSSSDFYEKKNDIPYNHQSSSTDSLLKIKKGTSFLTWNSQMKMKLEWTIRFISFFVVLAVPLTINKFIIYPNEPSLLKGLIGYSTFVGIIMVISQQKHRISHISGLGNPYFIGYITSLLIHNYVSFYAYLFGPMGIFGFISILLTIWHVYSFYQIVIADPGFCKESFKKPDGTSYDLRDLMSTNVKDLKCTKDSINWFTEPPGFSDVSKPVQMPQLYFCEPCQIVQSLPTKHCKLCEACCSKFDHHCLFIGKCVGLKNHRPFILFLISTLVCTLVFVYSTYSHLSDLNAKINSDNVNLKEEDQSNLIYVLFTSTIDIWLVVLALINGFSALMVFFLFSFQIKFITLGYTSQFRPPAFFTKTNKKMETLMEAFKHRFENLYIFFFESCESNQNLYFRQQNEYNSSMSDKPIPLSFYSKSKKNNRLKDLYPKDHFDLNASSNNGTTKATLSNFQTNKLSTNNENKQFEIELD